jgi:uncharacterized protein YjbJ (UPF0337 family)
VAKGPTRDRITGLLDTVAGRVLEAFGRSTGRKSQKAKGKAARPRGTVRPKRSAAKRASALFPRSKTPTAGAFDADWLWPRSADAKRWRRYAGTVTVARTGADSDRWSLGIRRTLRRRGSPLGVRTLIRRSGVLP